MDLIDRQAAIDFIDAGRLCNPNEPRWSDNEVVNFLKTIPSAEKTGKWIVHTDKFANGAEYFGYATCSECGEMFYAMDTIGHKPIWDYCPNCGARMVD